MYSGRIHEIRQLIDLCISELKFLWKGDEQTGDWLRRWEINKQNMQFLFEHKLLIEEDREETRIQAIQLWEMVMTIRKDATTEKAKKEKLVYPWRVD